MTYVDRVNKFDAELAEAVADPDNESLLVAMHRRQGLDARERAQIVLALGETGAGSEGSRAVRAEFTGAMHKLAIATKSTRSQWRDNVCAAVVALAERDGGAATDVYLAAIESSNPAVRDYGLDALAVEGDERAWDYALARISQIAGRKPISPARWYELIQLLEYASRHAGRGTARAEQLLTLLRGSWDTLSRPPEIKKRMANPRGRFVTTETATRLEQLWPGIRPDGPSADAIDLSQLHNPAAWRRHHQAYTPSYKVTVHYR